MDGFYYAEATRRSRSVIYNGSTVPVTWDLAEQYALGDNFFAGNLSYSLPNHWDLVAGGRPNITYNSYLKTGADRSPTSNQANATPTVQDLLNGTSVTWNYYDFALENRPRRRTARPRGARPTTTGTRSPAGPSPTRRTRRSTSCPRQQLLTDLDDGSLPHSPGSSRPRRASEHPGYNITGGEAWLAQFVDAVENSPDWASTAIFVTWDDYGGWYDHVAPAVASTGPLSFRAPILVISPYAKENYISHDFLDFFSLLHFDEWQFGLGCLTSLDC